MTDRSLAIRLAVVDGGKVKAELRDVGETGSRSLKRIEDAAQPASRALQALDGTAGQIRGNLEGMAGRLGSLGAGLARIGPAGLVAAAAIGGIGLALQAAFQEAAEADRSQRRLEAVLKATGHAAGLTAREITSFADGLEAATLATAEGVQDAAAILATFRSVSGETFTRALTLAQDLAAVFGQDLSSAATQLGKALEDPQQGLTALRRVGISFSDSQRELIATLVETGRQADAQRVILDALEQQVGGAGAAEAGGLTGATNRLGDAWGNLLEAIGRTPAVTSVAEGALHLLSSALEGLSGALAEDPIGRQIEAAKSRLLQAKEELARLEAGGPGTPLLGQRFAGDEQRRRIAALEQELATLTRIGEEEAKAAEQEKARAESGQRAAETARRAEALAGQQRALDKALSQLVSDPAEKISAVNRELAETRQRLDALRAPDGSNTSAIEAATGQAEEVARRKIAQIRQPLAERMQREADSERQAAERVFEANTKIIDDLSRQLAGFGDERQRFIDQALSRLSEGATADPRIKSAERAEVERLADALYAEKLNREQLAETLRAEEKLREEGARLMAESRTPAEELADTLAHLDALMRAGAIDAATHGRAVAEAYARMEDAAARALEASRHWRDGVGRALQDYAAEATDAVRAAEQVTANAFRGMEDALVAFVQTGKLEWQGLIDAMIADLTRLMIRQMILGPIAGALGSGFSSLFGSGAGGTTGPGLSGDAVAGVTAHGGGIVGRDSLPTNTLPAALFEGAPRLHRGLAPDEIPAILQRGEGVFTPGQMAALGRVTVNVINNAGAEVTVEERQSRDGIDLAIGINRMVAGAIRSRGTPAHQAVLEVAGRGGPALVQR